MNWGLAALWNSDDVGSYELRRHTRAGGHLRQDTQTMAMLKHACAWP